METTYRRTQINLATTLILGLSAVVAASMLWSLLDRGAGSAPPASGAQVCIGLYLAGVVAAWLAAYRLTIEVNAYVVRWQVGVGLLRDSHSLAEIETAAVVAAPFSLLPRIRRAGSTRFISVAPGRRGVELALTDGRRIVLGANDAESLVAVISAAKAG